MNKNHTIFALLVVAAFCLGYTGIARGELPEGSANSAQAFEKLKALAGRWEGSTPAGKIALEYEVVSGGTALVEREYMPADSDSQPGEPMVTVYHLDRGRLVLTHYCHIGNQPHMQAAAFDSKSNEIRFEFTGAGNLTSESEAVMHGLVLKFKGPDELATEWTLYAGGKAQAPMAFLYHRVK